LGQLSSLSMPGTDSGPLNDASGSGSFDMDSILPPTAALQRAMVAELRALKEQQLTTNNLLARLCGFLEGDAQLARVHAAGTQQQEDEGPSSQKQAPARARPVISEPPAQKRQRTDLQAAAAARAVNSAEAGVGTAGANSMADVPAAVTDQVVAAVETADEPNAAADSDATRTAADAICEAAAAQEDLRQVCSAI